MIPSAVEAQPARAPAPAAEAAERSRRRESLAMLVGPPAVVFAAFIGLWCLASRVLITRDDARGDFLLPMPNRVWSRAFADTERLREILGGLRYTAVVALAGFGLVVLIGVAVAVLMSQSRLAERALYPYLVLIQTIPIIALVPLIGLALSYSFRARLLVAVLLGFFPIVANTLFGLRSVDRAHHDLFTLHGASRLTRLRKLMLPSALPALFTGMRIASGLVVIGSIVSDFFFKQGDKGLGQLLEIYRANLQTEMLIGAIVWSSLLAIALFTGIGLLRRIVIGKWHESARELR
ncbi:MAG: ABC transporter permease [Acidimicrobiales bacterium]